MQVDQRTALQALVSLSHAVDLELVEKKTKKGPLFAFLVFWRREAIDALKALVEVDPAKVEDVRKLQNEVQRFVDAADFVRKALATGYEAALALKEEEEREALALLGDEERGDE